MLHEFSTLRKYLLKIFSGFDLWMITEGAQLFLRQNVPLGDLKDL